MEKEGDLRAPNLNGRTHGCVHGLLQPKEMAATGMKQWNTKESSSGYSGGGESKISKGETVGRRAPNVGNG